MQKKQFNFTSNSKMFRNLNISKSGHSPDLYPQTPFILRVWGEKGLLKKALMLPPTPSSKELGVGGRKSVSGTLTLLPQQPKGCWG